MKDNEWELHISVLGWLYILGHAIFLVIGGLGAIFLPGIGLSLQDPELVRILSVVGGVGAVFFTLLAIPGIITGIGLLKRKTWARVLALVLAVLGLVNFPIGTVVGIYALWLLLQPQMAEHFAPLSTA